LKRNITRSSGQGFGPGYDKSKMFSESQSHSFMGLPNASEILSNTKLAQLQNDEGEGLQNA